MAIVGSRKLTQIIIDKYVPEGVTEIVWGGASGIDTLAEKYAYQKGIPLTAFQPEYERYGRAAPIIRNKEIVDYADRIIVLWDGNSKGALSVIKYAEKANKRCEVFILKWGCGI